MIVLINRGEEERGKGERGKGWEWWERGKWERGERGRGKGGGEGEGGKGEMWERGKGPKELETLLLNLYITLCCSNIHRPCPSFHIF
jgi:hypothetical protein